MEESLCKVFRVPLYEIQFQNSICSEQIMLSDSSFLLCLYRERRRKERSES